MARPCLAARTYQRRQPERTAALTRAVLRVFLRTVFGWQRRRATQRGLVEARSGSVTAIQRFGGSANLNVHFHALLFDGVYTRPSPTTRPRFYRLPPPTDADIAQLLRRLRRRVGRLLIRRRRGSDEDAGRDPFAAQEPLFASAVAASLQSRVGLGARAGQPVRRLRSAAAAPATGRRSARLEGFSLHADVAVPARRRDQLEKLCRYVVRPPLALERLTESAGGSCCTSSGGRGATGRRRSSWTRWSCWNGSPPSCPRRGGRCWPTTGSSPRALAGERPSSRPSLERPTPTCGP
jgi:hypothetical protein